MYTLIICLFIAALFPILSKLIMVYPIVQANDYDNSYPRQQQNGLTGFGARALGAHKNSFEALIVFAPAVVTAIATHTITQTTEFLAIFFIASRIVYHGLYLLNLSTARSIVWTAGYVASMAILWACIP